MILKRAMFCEWVVEMSGSSQDLMAQLNFYGVGVDPFGRDKEFLNTCISPHVKFGQSCVIL